MQINGDLEDLESALQADHHTDKAMVGSGHCSALIKLLPQYKDVYVAQDTWTTYQSMLRILKKYDLHYQQYLDSGIKEFHIIFSKTSDLKKIT